jgi:uncharacterized membrane protein YeiH
LTASKKKMDGLHIYSCFRDGCRGGTCAMSWWDHTSGWMLDLEYVYVICIACVFAVLFRKNSTDCGPLSFYLILSGWVFTFWSWKGINVGLHPNMYCFGNDDGLLWRCNSWYFMCRNSVNFRKEIYATICILGGVVFYLEKI